MILDNNKNNTLTSRIYKPTCELRSADAHLLEVPRCRLHMQGERHFRVLLHGSGTICRLPCVPQTPSVLSRSYWRHFYLKERFHFKRTILYYSNIFNMYYLSTILLFMFYCNIINYYLFLISTVYQLLYYLFIFKL